MTNNELIEGYLDGVLDEAGLAEFNLALGRDPEFARALAAACTDDAILRELVAGAGAKAMPQPGEVLSLADASLRTATGRHARTPRRLALARARTSGPSFPWVAAAAAVLLAFAAFVVLQPDPAGPDRTMVATAPRTPVKPAMPEIVYLPRPTPAAQDPAPSVPDRPPVPEASPAAPEFVRQPPTPPGPETIPVAPRPEFVKTPEPGPGKIPAAPPAPTPAQDFVRSPEPDAPATTPAPVPATTVAAVARVIRANGDVRFFHQDGSSEPAREGAELASGGGLAVRGNEGAALLVWTDGTRFDLHASTEVACSDGPDGKRVELRRGVIDAAVARQPEGRPLVIKTPTAAATVVGTQFRLEAGLGRTELEVTEGRVDLTRASDRRTVQVKAGQTVAVAPREAFVVLPVTLAFPGAEGPAALTRGGRGGRVIEVTNLDDAGPGSLRAAVDAKGPRIVVFRTGGTIVLKKQLNVKEPFITLAGQTAPGGGIALRNAPGSTDSPLRIQTNDVVVRHLRIRPGPTRQKSPFLSPVRLLEKSPAARVVLDHLSMTWGTDVALFVGAENRDVTIQRCLIAEGLENSSHPDGAHSLGVLVQGPVEGFTAARNVFAHFRLFGLKITGGMADVVGNLFYNSGPLSLNDQFAMLEANAVGNDFVRGPDHGATLRADRSAGAGTFVHASANRLDGAAIADPSGDLFTAHRFQTPHVRYGPDSGGVEALLADVGATLPARDAADQRIIAGIRAKAGKIIDAPGQVGGWPEIAAGAPLADGDHDGMPDAWEAKFGLNFAGAADGTQDPDRDGYTNVEEFLNGTHPGRP